MMMTPEWKCVWFGIIVVLAMASVVLCVDALLFLLGIPFEAKLYPSRFATTTSGGGGAPMPGGVVICTLARDIQRNALTCMQRIERIGQCFSTYQVLVYENGSQDGSRRLLQEWAMRNPNVRLLDEVVVPADEHNAACTGYELECKGAGRLRMQRMARCRNHYLDALDAMDAAAPTKEAAAGVVMVIDFDCAGVVSLDGLRTAMACSQQWDSCSANGTMQFPPLYLVESAYDSMAFLSADEPVERQLRDPLMRRHIRHTAFYMQRVRPHQHQQATTLVPVASAFNGCTLYRRDALRGGVRYDSLTDAVVGCEHVGLHLQMRANGFTRTFVCPAFRVTMGRQGNDNYITMLMRARQNKAANTKK